MLFALHCKSRPSDYMVQLLVTHSQQYASIGAEKLKQSPITSKLIRDAMEIEKQMVNQGDITAEQMKVRGPDTFAGESRL